MKWWHLSIGLGVLLVVVGVIFLFLPLSPVIVNGTELGTCGPGASSDSAIVAKFSTGRELAGREPRVGYLNSEWRGFVTLCEGKTNDRLDFAATFGLIGLIGIGASLFVRARRSPSTS